MIKATSEVTLTDETDVDKLVPWYQLTGSTTPPSAPTTTQTSDTVSNWTQNEPSFDPAQGTKYLYTVWQTRWKDGSCTWGTVQLSSSYEQAKQAWNKANAAYSATQPIATKTYTGIIGTANDAANASFYFAKVHPDDYNGMWAVKLRIAVTAPTTYQETIDISISGRANAFMAYDSFVGRSTAALAMYFINLYRAKQAGITAGKGHALGFGLRASTNPTNATYARTITVDVIEQANCTVQLLDAAVKYASMDGTGATSYEGLTELGVANNGQNATGNSNTNYSQQSPVKAGANGVWGYSLIMQAADGRWNSIFTAPSWNGAGTGKSRYTGGFVLGRILYSSGVGTQTSSSSTTATYYRYDTDVTTSTTWDVYPLDLRYSTNCATSLVAYKPVYLVGTVGSDGLFYLDATWWTQTLPSTEDGKVYVYVGETYSTYQIYLASEHTALVYHDGGIKTYQQMLSDEAAKVAGNYITKVGTGDAWVHSEGHGPDANGDATANTYGWRIGSVFELVRAGLSYIRMWVDNSVAKVRVGLESAGHSVFSPDGMEVFTDATTSVAKFGSDGARIGDAEGERFAVRSDRLQAYDEDGELYFEASAERLAYGSSVAASEADVANLDGYVRGYEYVLTTDTVAQEGTAYYSLVDGEYVEFPATAGTTDVTGKYVLSNADSVDGRIAAVDRGYRDAVYAVSLDVDRNDGTIRSLVSALGSGAASVFEQDGDSFTFSLDRAFKGIDDDFKKIRDYVQISGDTLTLGSSSHPVVARLTSTGLTFYPTISPHGEWAVSTAYAVGDKVVHDFAFYECAQAHTSSASSEPGTESGADYWNPVKVERQINYESPIASLVVEGTGEDAQGVLVIHRAVVVNELRLGDWAWMPRGNGNLSLKWIGE